MKIRKAKLEDLGEITKIAKESIKFHSRYRPNHSTSYSIRKAANYYAKGLRKSIQNDIFLVAETEKIVGYVYGDIKKWYPGYKVGWVIDIAVDKAYWNKGIGKTLLKEIIFAFKRKRCREVYLDVLTENERALHLYDSLGFSKTGYRMRKIL